MPIFRAIGLGIFIITLKLLLPNVLIEGEQTLIAFLQGAQASADIASNIAASANLSSSAGTAPSPLFLPRTPPIPSY